MNLTQKITQQTNIELNQCIACGACIKACPVYDHQFSIQDLNNATNNSQHITNPIKQFTFACMQCQQCIPVCPQHIHRDIMMLKLKNTLLPQRPWSYKRYLLIRHPHPKPHLKIIQYLFKTLKKITHPNHAPYMETIPQNPQPLLFYPGCYIYSPKTITRIHTLLNHLNIPYTTLAGVSTCCGLPHYLQGNFTQAEECLNHLTKQIKHLKPTTIITSCNECLEALTLIKHYHNLPFTPKHITTFLLDHINHFPQKKLRETITLHDPCRYNRNNNTDPYRQTIQHFSTLKEMPHHQQNALCCTHWNHTHSPKNHQIQKQRISEAKNTAPTMACACLTCYEEYQKQNTTLEIIDLLQLFEEALTHK